MTVHTPGVPFIIRPLVRLDDDQLRHIATTVHDAHTHGRPLVLSNNLEVVPIADAKVLPILLDLIAELRFNYAGGRMLEMADRAEARLREVLGDE